MPTYIDVTNLEPNPPLSRQFVNLTVSGQPDQKFVWGQFANGAGVRFAVDESGSVASTPVLLDASEVAFTE